MAEVFISYKRENQDAVQRLVEGLRDGGLGVWWDQDIAPDDPWEATIERELEAAKVVIVAWSLAAVASENVKAEARRARNQGKLIQIYIEACDPPLFFGERQGVDLTTWRGATEDNRFKAVMAASRALLAGRRPPQGVGYRPRKRAPWASLTGTFVFLSAVLGFFSNLGGARDALCSVPGVRAACTSWNLIVPERSEGGARARERLLASVNGRWGRQERDCSDAVEYTVTQTADGFERIIVRAPSFESSAQVIAVENGAILTRETAPSSRGGREQWELRPSADQMVVLDKDGVATTLIRCEA